MSGVSRKSLISYLRRECTEGRWVESRSLPTVYESTHILLVSDRFCHL